MGAHERTGAETDRAGSPARRAPGSATRSGQASAAGHALRVEGVTDLADLEALTDRWAALVHTSPQATAYASPAFVLTWYRHFERRGGIYAATVWRGADLVGIAPFARTRLGRGPASATLLVSAGTEHGDYGDPLLGPDPEPVADAIADHLASLARRRTVVNLRRLRDDGAAIAALEAHDDLARRPMGQVAESAVVRFDQIDDPAQHLRRLANKHSVPRRMRRLAEAHGPVEYQPDDPDPTAALDTMRDMLNRRWGPDQGPAIFRGPRMEAFTRDTLRALVDSGFGRIATLTAGDRPVAVTSVFTVDDRYTSDNAAVEPDLGEFGPGQAAIHRMLHHAHDAGATEVDLRAGDYPYKYRWTNASHRTRSLALTTPGREGQAMLAARRVMMSLRARRLARLRHQLPAAFGDSAGAGCWRSSSS